MSEFNLTVPVTFIIFNRPEHTSRVFETIRNARPKKLFIIGDGSRASIPGEQALVKRTRDIVEQVDWDCEVIKNYADVNLGCRERVSSGLRWVFSQADEAIILEDDCLPDPSFFQYCQELLEHYRNDENVMMISGNNVIAHLPPKKVNKYSDKAVKIRESFYFSRYNHIWGWAGWKRTYNAYDLNMKDWPEIKNTSFLREHVYGRKARKYWNTIFDEVHSGKINTWDYQLLYSHWKQQGLTVIPKNNLVVNLGFGAEASHTKSSGGLYSMMKNKQVSFPLVHPLKIERNYVADMVESKVYHRFGIKEKIRRLFLLLRIKV